MVSAIEGVDVVDVNIGGEDSKPAILRNMPDIILVGDDYKPREKYLKQLGVTESFLERYSIEIRFTPYTKGISSSEIKARIIDRYLDAFHQ